MDLSGKVAFITGSASGIGRGYAQALLGKGAKVFMVDVNDSVGADTLAEFEGKYGKDNVRFAKLDVTDAKQFEEAFQSAVAAFGQVDIMLNNAGIMNEGAWELSIGINLTAVVIGTKLAEKHMRKDKGGKGGRIINISSMAGLDDVCVFPVYCATKHAVRAYTMALAGQFDLESQGIEYATICPRAVNTTMINSLNDDKINFFSEAKKRFGTKMEIEHVVGGVIGLLELTEINGATLAIEREGYSYKKLEKVDLGKSFVPAVQKPS